MKDFAAAAMMRLVRLGLERQGLSHTASSTAAPQGALVPLQSKREVLDHLLRQHGPGLLLRLGEAVREAADEPTLAALTAARDAKDLIERWQRLERFVHSRHRVVTLSMGATGCTLQHVSLQAGEAPTAAEDLLVFGLLVGLLGRIGVADVQAGWVGDAGWSFQAGQWTNAPASTQTATWALQWRPSASSPLSPCAEGAATTPQAARALLAADCAASWTLARLAAGLGLPPRSLQRRLNEAGTSFSSLWTEVRLAHSARLLLEGSVSAAQVGYLSGFSDQAHFSRSFRRHTAMTPTNYRAQFSPSAASAAGSA